MDIFHINENLKSYTYPIVKLLICTGLILLCVFQAKIIQTDSMPIKAITGVLAVIVLATSWYCNYISIFEICQVYENRSALSKNKSYTIDDSCAYTIDEILNMVETNDIIEIRIIANDRSFLIGSSSDCKQGSSKFFDKLFFADKKEFEKIEDFERELIKYSKDGIISVISIDDIPTKET